MLPIRKLFVAAILLVLAQSGAYSQVYLTRSGFVGFYSRTSLEDIKAENNQVFDAIKPGKRTMAFSLLLKGFVFTKQLMQEHFNENYVESDKYPKAAGAGAGA